MHKNKIRSCDSCGFCNKKEERKMKKMIELFAFILVGKYEERKGVNIKFL